MGWVAPGWVETGWVGEPVTVAASPSHTFTVGSETGMRIAALASPPEHQPAGISSPPEHEPAEIAFDEQFGIIGS